MVPPESPGDVARGRWRQRSQKNDHEPRPGDEARYRTRLTNPLTTVLRFAGRRAVYCGTPVGTLTGLRLCSIEREVDYRTFEGFSHNDSTQKNVPLMLEWTAARFAGEPAATTCP